jgi:hypothetical protein
VTTYRYLLADLRTNAILAELPFTGVQFSQSLNAIGTMSASLEITDTSEVAMNIMPATIPGRCAIYVDRNGELIWGGVIWSRSYNSNSQRIQINAREFLSYFERRRIVSDLGYTTVDQLTIAQQLILNAQGAGAGNIGVAVGTETSGVTISKNYYAYELKTVYSALSDLSRSSTGFDYRIDVAYDGSNNPTKTLKLGYPRLGTVYSSANVSAPVFEFPAGNVIEYEWPEDGSLAANILYTSGAGSNEGKLISTQTNTTYQNAGWPILEDSANYSDVTDQTLLTNLAAGQLAAVVYPPTTLKIVAPANQEPQVGSFNIGDDVRIRIRDPRFPNGIDQTMRLVSLAVTVGESNQAETQTLTLSLPTS